MLSRRQPLLLGTCDPAGQEATFARPALLTASELADRRWFVFLSHRRSRVIRAWKAVRRRQQVPSAPAFPWAEYSGASACRQRSNLRVIIMTAASLNDARPITWPAADRLAC